MHLTLRADDQSSSRSDDQTIIARPGHTTAVLHSLISSLPQTLGSRASRQLNDGFQFLQKGPRHRVHGHTPWVIFDTALCTGTKPCLSNMVTPIRFAHKQKSIRETNTRPNRLTATDTSIEKFTGTKEIISKCNRNNNWKKTLTHTKKQKKKDILVSHPNPQNVVTLSHVRTGSRNEPIRHQILSDLPCHAGVQT